MDDHDRQEYALSRIARALERMIPEPTPEPDFSQADAFTWQPEPERFISVVEVNRVPLTLLRGIDRMRDVLRANTEQFGPRDIQPTTLCYGVRAAWAKVRW